MNAIELLISDHRAVDEMFDRFEKSRDDSERAELVGSMVAELSRHAAIEEQELYPLLQRVLRDNQPVEHAEHEHAEAKAVLAALSQMKPGDEQFDPMVSELISDVRHHVHEEESELFPQLREAVSDDELAEVGQRLEQAKKNAPTRPSAEELQALSAEELQEFAQRLQVEGRSDMNKQQLAQALTG